MRPGPAGARDILAVATEMASRLGRELPPELLLHDAARRSGAPRCEIEVPDDAGPDLLGRLHEGSFDRRARHGQGAFYTPPAIAAGVVELAMSEPWPHAGPDVSVCDTAVGGGAFLLAAARALVAAGADPGRVVRWQLFGADIDGEALVVAEVALWLWSASLGQPAVIPAGRLVVTDGRVVTPATWGRDDGFDLVIGNPPFQAQRRRATARSPEAHASMRERFGEAVEAQTDDAALFWLGATELLAPGGRSALILPESLLGARDATAVRGELGRRARILALWRAGQQVFDVPVRVCAPVLEANGLEGEAVGDHHGEPERVTLSIGPDFRAAGHARVPAAAASWASLLRVDALPSIDRLRTKGVLGDLVEATAGYRDQYYGIINAVVDNAEPGPRRMQLVTSGAIDPSHLRWGTAPVRFANKSWSAPVVDLDILQRTNPAMARWATARSRPKVLLATQTKVLEAVVDTRGWAYPSVPVISVSCAEDDLWRVLAVLLSPAMSVWAHEVAAGGALSANSVKLRASQVLDLPLPADIRYWDEGALQARASQCGDVMVRRTFLTMLADTMNTAYGIRGDASTAMSAWWIEQLGPPR